MSIIYRRCAGLDVHKKSISVCAQAQVGGQQPRKEPAIFGTFTCDLQAMADWLKARKVRHVAMESTGVYWKPVWNVLESSKWKFDLLLVNPQLVRALPGKKTDHEDSERICGYLQQGLLRGSFVPPKRTRELRELTRRRAHLEGDRNRVINRIGRLLETANVKLGSVISNIVGKSGRAMLQAISRGESDPKALAALTTGRLKCTLQDLERALTGRYDEHLQWCLGELLEELNGLDRRVSAVELRIGQLAADHRDVIARLCTLPGVDVITAHTILAEIGTDMSQFPDARHLASWAGLCPGNSESAGKRFSGRTRKGNRYLRRILVQNAWAVAHMHDCALTALFYRVAAHAGMKKAAVAVAHRILMLAYYVIRDGTEYREAGGDYYDRRNPTKTAKRLTRRLEKLGFEVSVKPRKEEPPKPRPGPLPGQTCKRCNAWGIACMHVRPRPAHTPEAPSR
ncbi:MAG: IS110 family transposase [Acidobacteriia bacterium]|nr:IS110 family transposase [Terriglobia bacterium]